MSADARAWFDHHKLPHPHSGNNNNNNNNNSSNNNNSGSSGDDASSLTNVYSKFISRFLPEQPEKSMDGVLLSKPLTKPPPPGMTDCSTNSYLVTV